MSNTKEMFPFPIIRKRDGRMTRFDIGKISGAIYKAFYATGVDDEKLCQNLAEMVVEDLKNNIEGNVPQVEEIQDAVERILIREGYATQAKAFILYRAKRTAIREGKSELMDSVEEILQETRKETPFTFNSPSAKMLKIASAASRAYYLTRLIPSQFADAHNRGDIHIHDIDYYGKTINSLQIPLERLLKNGFFSGYGHIRPPKHISTISALTAIIIQSCQNDMYGGQSIPAFDTAISNYITNTLGWKDVNPEEMDQAMEGLVYNLNMIYSRMGAQVPISTINIGLDTTPIGKQVTLSLLKAIQKGLGRGETPLFPWVIFHVKKGVNLQENDPNYNLFLKAIEVSSRRMNPSFAFLDSPLNISEKNVAYWGDGGRAATSFIKDAKAKSDIPIQDMWGWGNIAQVTINMPRIAFKIAHKRKDFLVKSFYSEIKRTMELCAKQLIHRKDVVSGLKKYELPFVMGQGVYLGSHPLAPDESIHRALNFGFMSIGFVGLAEAIYIMYGRDHSHNWKMREFAAETVDFMLSTAQDLSEEFEEKFILTASSSGYAAQRFPQLDRIEFGITPAVNDKEYYTQGFSIPASREISWEEKLEIEGIFHEKIEGGHFTYLEASQMISPDKYKEVLLKMRKSNIAFGGVSFPLIESLDDGKVVKEKDATSNTRTIRRAAGLLLPLDRINNALKEELKHKKYDL